MFGDRLRELRRRDGVTQEQLAVALGVERSSIGKYEGKSKVVPSDDVKQRIAQYFNVSMDYLFGMESQEKPTAGGDELDSQLITLLQDLSPEEVQRVQDFVAGLKAARKDSASHQG